MRTPVRQTIIDTLDREAPRALTTLDLARAVYQTDEPTDAQLSAVRRACAKLISDGRIERAGRAWSVDQHEPRYHERRVRSDPWLANYYATRGIEPPGPRTHVYSNPGGMAYRRPLTPAERRKQERTIARLRARLAAL